MKHLFTIAVLACGLFLSACQKDVVPLSSEKNGDKVSVTVSLAGETRATGSYDSHEGDVKNIQVFCFDKTSGLREGYETSTTSQSVTLGITTGTKRLYALANCPDLSSILKESELLAAVTEFSQNSLSQFVMVSPTGTEAEKVISSTCTVTLTVKRIVAKVLVDKITANLESVGYRSADFTISKIYLTDVAKKNNYGLTATPTEFYSGSADNGTAVNAMIYEGGLTYNLKNSGSSTVKHGFYAYPNSSSTKTKLVLEGELLGVKQVYSFDLPALERNKVYEVTEITLTKMSGEYSNATVNIAVSNWETGTTFPLSI